MTDTNKPNPIQVKACMKRAGIYLVSKHPKPLLAAFSPDVINAAADKIIAAAN